MFDALFLNPVAGLADEALRAIFYRRMLMIRLCEQKLLDLFATGRGRGTVHTCLGQEACAVGVMAALDAGQDIVCSNHRGHGHYLAYCGDVAGLIAEILGLPSGVCGGVGGSQHLHRDNFYTNGILGGMPPVATGMAAAEKLLRSGRVVCVFLGDGAMAQGNVYESLNMAALWQLPILFVVEHNHYAQSTHWEKQHAGQFASRASAFGVAAREVDGNCVLSVHAQASELIQEMRAGGGPRLLLLHTYRLGPHSKGDDFRDPDEIRMKKSSEPLQRLREELGTVWCDAEEKAMGTALDAVVQDLIGSMNHG